MVAFANSRACRQKAILQYFGDNSAANCNICDRCQGKAGWPTIPEEKRLEIEERKKQEAALSIATASYEAGIGKIDKCHNFNRESNSRCDSHERGESKIQKCIAQ
jgi:superfamily II DNA helicase RecQ